MSTQPVLLAENLTIGKNYKTDTFKAEDIIQQDGTK
jgi:hypothetical protein